MNLEKDRKNYVSIALVWTRMDSGKMTHHWRERYLKRFNEFKPMPIKGYINLPLPLSYIMSLAAIYQYKGYHFHFGTIFSDYWWSEDFIEILAEEFEQRTHIEGAMAKLNYMPMSSNAKWRTNCNQSHMTGRDFLSYVGDWMFFKDKNDSQKIAQRMRDFQEKNREHWIYKDGKKRSVWMSPETIYDGSTNMEDESVARSFYPDEQTYNDLRKLKRIVDPENRLCNQGTIPPIRK